MSLSSLISIISFKVLFSTSKQNLCVISASSHVIKLVTLSNSANSFPWVILQTKSSKVGTGILNFECVVLPLGGNKEAISLDAIVKTIFFLC
ncbi:hypothetical protein JHK87_043800 [Glycine soja]|nr:hypothetical protein JHK87_043800 [Glycine soja]